MSDETRVGEVVEACTSDFVAQCYELYQSPPLGCLVNTRGEINQDHPEENSKIFGVVCKVATTGFEPGRHAVARGKDEQDEDEIYRSNPQLSKLLKSEFSVLIIGYREGDSIFQYLPPKPARIHSFVHLCSPTEVKLFSSCFDFLNILLKARIDISTEELIGASLRQMALVYGIGRHDFLLNAGRELAALLSRDYGQLKAILKGLKYDAAR